MANRGPVTVRIDDGTTDRMVTAHTSGVKFRRTAPGGFHSAELTVNLPRATFTDLGPGDRIWIYDARTARTLFEGKIDNPGVVDGPAGQSFDITATGTMILLQDRSQALLYIDSDLSDTEAYAGPTVPTSASVQTGTNPATGDTTDTGVTCQLNSGTPVGTGQLAQVRYLATVDAGLAIAAVAGVVTGGKADAGWHTDLASPTGDRTNLTNTLQTAPVPFTRWAGTSAGLPLAQTSVGLELARNGAATNVADDTTWAYFGHLVFLGRRVDATGAWLDGPTALVAATYVQADWVVADLIGRVLTFVDVDASQITPLDPAAAYQIDQLTYLDGARPGDVLDDLIGYEPGYLYEVLESGPGGYRFNWRPWGAQVRYEISTRDGYDAPGGEDDLCNRVVVYWTDARGRKRSTVVTANSDTYPALSALEQTGRIKDADPITLPDGKGSAANAARIGAQTLAAKADPPKAATATVRRRLHDLHTGNLVYPWELESGYLVRVRETGDVLPLTEVEVDVDERAANLTLGYPVPSDDQQLAQLSRRVKRAA